MGFIILYVHTALANPILKGEKLRSIDDLMCVKRQRLDSASSGEMLVDTTRALLKSSNAAPNYGTLIMALFLSLAVLPLIMALLESSNAAPDYGR
jgi:hypothetical protein